MPMDDRRNRAGVSGGVLEYMTDRTHHHDSDIRLDYNLYMIRTGGLDAAGTEAECGENRRADRDRRFPDRRSYQYAVLSKTVAHRLESTRGIRRASR